MTRDEVSKACKLAGRTYRTDPPGSAGVPVKVPDIPKCDPAWAPYWPKAKTSGGAVHVVTANMKKEANYCDVR